MRVWILASGLLFGLAFAWLYGNTSFNAEQDLYAVLYHIFPTLVYPPCSMMRLDLPPIQPKEEEDPETDACQAVLRAAHEEGAWIIDVAERVVDRAMEEGKNATIYMPIPHVALDALVNRFTCSRYPVRVRVLLSMEGIGSVAQALECTTGGLLFGFYGDDPDHYEKEKHEDPFYMLANYVLPSYYYMGDRLAKAYCHKWSPNYVNVQQACTPIYLVPCMDAKRIVHFALEWYEDPGEFWYRQFDQEYCPRETPTERCQRFPMKCCSRIFPSLVPPHPRDMHSQSEYDRWWPAPEEEGVKTFDCTTTIYINCTKWPCYIDERCKDYARQKMKERVGCGSPRVDPLLFEHPPPVLKLKPPLYDTCAAVPGYIEGFDWTLPQRTFDQQKEDP